MRPLNRRQFVYGTGAVLGSTLFGCGRQQEPIADSELTVFMNGTVLPVDAAFSGHEIGRLEPGKLADFVVLDQDPRRIERTALSSVGISETWMNGVRVYNG